MADVVGYSLLMGADEKGTLDRLTAHRREIWDAKIGSHRGRIVKTIGDGLLVEFSSIVNAVRCAIEIQRAMIDRNAAVPEDKRITLRIGINFGDVIFDGGDIYGDVVNVSQRIETLAEPGGICISGSLYDQVRDKLPYAFEDMGERSLKNIATPVRVFAMNEAAVARTPLVPIKSLARAVMTTASSLPEEFASQSIMGSQITLYTVDATLIDKGTPITKTVSDPSSGRTHTETTCTYVFSFDNGRQWSVTLTNFDLPFVTGAKVTLFLFTTPQGKEELFSIYNHDQQLWKRLPFNRHVNLNNEQERELLTLVTAAFALIIVASLFWFKESPRIFPLFLVPLGLVGLVFMVRNWLRRERLISRMERLQHHGIHMT